MFRSRIWTAAVLLALAAGLAPQAPAADIPRPGEDQAMKDFLNRFDYHAPAIGRTMPRQARRVLIYNHSKGFDHPSIPFVARAMEHLGNKTGAFEPELSSEPAAFAAANLARFDGVLLNNTTGRFLLPADFEQLDEAGRADALEREKRYLENLTAFVRGGKGLIGLHAATDAMGEMPQYYELIGGTFAGHPWNAGDRVTIKCDDPGHPLNAAFHGFDFIAVSEIYQFRNYSRENQRILLSLNTTLTDMDKQGINRNDNDFAIAWCKSYGDGRVYYCSLTHNPNDLFDTAVVRHILDGIQFALGDLAADTTPSARLTDEDGFRRLFNGKDLTGWMPNDNWFVTEGALTRAGRGGDIWTAERFGDFVLDLEYMVADGANSGIFFRTDDVSDNVQTGIEVQVLDSFGKKRVDKHDAGAIYDIAAPTRNMVRAPGEWNRCILTCRGSQITVALNGERIVAIDLDDWTEPGLNPDGTKNKFRSAYRDMPREGHIGFQEHGGGVWYRNVRIRTLE